MAGYIPKALFQVIKNPDSIQPSVLNIAAGIIRESFKL